MNWITIYITGKSDFREEVRRKITHSDVNIMPGDIGQVHKRGFYDLYWLDSSVTLRSLKQAIGGKLIWKYRLRFYESLDSFIESQHNPDKSTPEFTEEEQAFMNAMRPAES